MPAAQLLSSQLGAAGDAASALPPSSFLPKMPQRARGLPPAPGGGGKGSGSKGGKGRSVHTLPSHPLAEVDQFLRDELECLDAASASSEVRLEPHRAALELFIARFDAAAPVLSAIKRAYEEQIRTLQRKVRGGATEHAHAHREYLAEHDRQIASLQGQIDELRSRLDAAKQEIALLKDDASLLIEGDGTSPKGLPTGKGSPSGKAGGAALPGGLLGSGGGGGGAVNSCAAAANSSPQRVGWGLVAKALDTERSKVSRMLRAIERLCTTPEMLEETAAELMNMLSVEQLCAVLRTACDSRRPDEHAPIAMAITRKMGAPERCYFLEDACKTLSDIELHSTLEPLALGLGAASREALIRALLEAVGLSEDERLGLARVVLQSAPPRPKRAKDAKDAKGVAGARLMKDPRMAGGDDEPNDPELLKKLAQFDLQQLAHCDGLLEMLGQIWGGNAVDRLMTILEALPPKAQKLAGNRLLTSGVVDALQLERALEHIYLIEDEALRDDPLLSGVIANRRHHSTVARGLLREGRVPKMHASRLQLHPLEPEDDPLQEPAGGLKLTCDCARLWIMPRELLHAVQGEKLSAGRTAPPLSVRRFEDTRAETLEARQLREHLKEEALLPSHSVLQNLRSVRKGAVGGVGSVVVPAARKASAAKPGKAEWHLSTQELLDTTAALWTEVVTERMGEVAQGAHLDVAELLWEQLLRQHGLKPLAQRALADLIVSLNAELELDEICPRLRLAAEMIGLGPREQPWPEPKQKFFFALLSLCVPKERMRQNLVEPGFNLPLISVHDLLPIAVPDPKARASLAAAIETHTFDWGGEPPPRTSSAPDAPPTVPAAATLSRTHDDEAVDALLHLEAAAFGAVQAEQRRAAMIAERAARKLVRLDTVLELAMHAWTARRDEQVAADELQLLTLCRAVDENDDGVLDFNEFKQLVSRAALTTSRDQLIPLYEQALARSHVLRQEALDREAARLRTSAGTAPPSKVELKAVASGNFANRFKASLPDAVDPAAFAEMVARNTRTAPDGFLDPVRDWVQEGVRKAAAAVTGGGAREAILMAPEWK